MPVFFRRRGKAKTIVLVEITGAGNASTTSSCFVRIDGKKYSDATSDIKVSPGDVITFSVYGYNATYYGQVTIDGASVLKVTSFGVQTHDWTVPKDIKAITVDLAYTPNGSRSYGRITVTTA